MTEQLHVPAGGENVKLIQTRHPKCLVSKRRPVLFHTHATDDMMTLAGAA